ncbi:MAG: hypothetical protein WC047_08750 [Kiritimatiellales bacterium]
MTEQEALKDLCNSDRAIIKGVHARKIAKAFGIGNPPCDDIQDNRSEFKGAHFPDLKEGEWARDVIDASVLACWICTGLHIDYQEMYGRGSQLRACCAAIDSFLKSNEK